MKMEGFDLCCKFQMENASILITIYSFEIIMLKKTC